MNSPTHDELVYGYDCITSDGAGAEITLMLSLLMVTDPVLTGVLKRIQGGYEAMLRQRGVSAPEGLEGAVLAGALSGAMTYGLHLGLHIGEARAAAKAEPE